MSAIFIQKYSDELTMQIKGRRIGNKHSLNAYVSSKVLVVITYAVSFIIYTISELGDIVLMFVDDNTLWLMLNRDTNIRQFCKIKFKNFNMWSVRHLDFSLKTQVFIDFISYKCS